MGADLALALGLLKVGLEIWKDERATQFQRDYLKLMESRDEEIKLGEDCSDELIDEIDDKLRNLAESFAFTARGK